MERVRREQIIGVILAGGLSSRMGGGDKGLLPLGRTSMLGEVVRRLTSQVAGLVLSANGDPSRFADLALPVVPDMAESHAGPLAGILAGMRWAETNTSSATHVLSVPSDVPFLPPDLVRRLVSALEGSGSRLAMARSAGALHPVIGLWPVDLSNDLEARLGAGARKVRAWAGSYAATVVDFPLLPIGKETIDPFFNANTPAELAEVRRLLDVVDP
ncbi:MAG: molybdenum cofactor guanylyltransferase MobA [Hyphomicrobiaceae bacterium]